MAVLLSGLAAFGFGAYLRSKTRVRVRPNSRQARQTKAVKNVDRSKNLSNAHALSFPSISQGIDPNSNDCRCR